MSLFALSAAYEAMRRERDEAVRLTLQRAVVPAVCDAARVLAESMADLQDDLSMALMDYTQRTHIIVQAAASWDGTRYHVALRTRLRE